MKREIANKLMCLFVERPALLKFSSKIEAWMEFFNDEHKNMIIDLLMRFKYITSDIAEAMLNNMLDTVLGEWGFAPEETILVGMSAGGEVDSGMCVAQMMKSVIASKDIKNLKIIPSIDKVYKNAEKCNKIVLIDEFVGTGSTVTSRIKSVIGNMKPRGDYELGVCVMAAMNKTKKVVCGHRYHSSLWLEAGISEFYRDDEINIVKNMMNDVELMLDRDAVDKYKKCGFPSFGYGGAEALYKMEAGNIPNSVFPVFWWPKISNTEEYSPLFRRYE